MARQRDSVNESHPPRIGRIPILELTPACPDPRWNPKAFVGELVPFEANVFREGHDAVGAQVELETPTGDIVTMRMHERAPGSDRWVAHYMPRESGNYRWRVRGFSDEWATWVHVAEIKLPAKIDVAVTTTLGQALLESALNSDSAKDLSTPTRSKLQAALTTLSSARSSVDKKLAAISHPLVHEVFENHPIASLESFSEWQVLRVERNRAGVGSWYEFFPRSEGAVRNSDGSWTSGTFASAQKRLAEVAQMGFDVVYLPPIHPIGRSHRKGPNNTLEAGEHDPGSPWAIGHAEGGHDAIHPELGTLKDFRDFVSRAQELGMEIALDLALQASPDHPWVTEHPEWFTVLPDGTIAYAENPPKKYQDIYPINFDRDREGIYAEVLRVVRHWIDQGVRIFRVDNPHTKPVEMWEWLIATVNAEHPDVIFLAEAFTRPAMMRTLAMVGFQQSYSYFTWRNSKAELEEFFTSISTETVDFYRPNLWTNTPDILTPYLQFGGKAAFTIRATLAATAAPSWGVYSGFELFESVARPGAEEAIDNEKFEFKPRDFAAAEKRGASLGLYLGLLNKIRREHPALGQLRNLRLQQTEDDSVIAYSKHLPAEYTGTGRADTIVVVVNLDPHSVRETKVHLNLEALGLPQGRFTVTDLVTGAKWEWGESNYVRLDAFENPAHILSVAHPRARS